MRENPATRKTLMLFNLLLLQAFLLLFVPMVQAWTDFPAGPGGRFALSPWVLLAAILTTTGAGLYIVRELLRLAHMEARLRRSEHLMLVGELAAGVAHEVRNPLTAIKGFLQLAVARASSPHYDPRAVEEYVSITLAEVNRLERLTSDFLLLARPARKTATVHLQELIGRVVREMVPVARERSVCLETAVDPGLPPCRADEDGIVQVLVNLVTNALQHTPPGGRVTVGAGTVPADQYVKITVRDTGPGIPPECLKQVFQPFYTTRENGTGLGLSICERIVHDHGGLITVASQMGAGAAFTVTLPYLPAPETRQQPLYRARPSARPPAPEQYSPVPSRSSAEKHHRPVTERS